VNVIVSVSVCVPLLVGEKGGIESPVPLGGNAERLGEEDVVLHEKVVPFTFELAVIPAVRPAEQTVWSGERVMLGAGFTK
jgi:hypothetical protein